jgi:hypothetical protein
VTDDLMTDDLGAAHGVEILDPALTRPIEPPGGSSAWHRECAPTNHP